MVILLTGQPGNGKTLTAFYYLVKHLQAQPDAEIVTNVKIFNGRLEGYLREKGSKPGLIDRIRPLEPEETTEFYRYSLKPRKWKEDNIGNVIPVDIPNPVVYVIDEAHLYWGARNFQKTSTAVLSYVSQHRHLGDNILLITQHPEQIDKAFRRLVDEYWLMTNLEKRRVMGFKGPAGMFKKSVYFHTPSIMQKPAENERFKIDLQLADCYDTSAGKRFGDTVADTKQKKKGFPFTLAIACLVVAVVATMWFIGNVPQWTQRGIGSLFKASNDAGQDIVKKVHDEGSALVGLKAPTNMPISLVTNQNMGWVKIPVSRKGRQTVNGRTVVMHEIIDEDVWTNLPPVTTTQQVAPAQQLQLQNPQPIREGFIANPGAVMPDSRWVRLRMWDGSTRLIRIKTDGNYYSPEPAGGNLDEETESIDGAGL